MYLKGESGQIQINILKRSNSQTNDYWDSNWLESEIKIDLNGFNSQYLTNLRVDDLNRFYVSVKDFHGGVIQDCEFTTLEEGLYLHFIVLYNGSVECKGKANNEGDILDFIIVTDFTFINTFVDELKVIIENYPLIGTPPSN